MAKFSASLRVFGDGLDFESISSGLHLKPSYLHRAGDSGRTQEPRSKDLWSLDSPLPRPEGLEAHLLWIENAVSPAYPFLRRLKDKAEVRSFCGVVAEGEARFVLSAKSLQLFTELDIEMELSLVFVGPSAEEPSESSLTTAMIQEDGIGSSEEIGRSKTSSALRLKIMGRDLDFEEISRSLGVQPSEVSGTRDLSSFGAPDVVNGWSLSVPVDPEERPNDHFLWLANFLSHHINSFRGLSARNDILIHCEYRTENDIGGFGISADALRTPVELGVRLEFDTFLI